MMKKLPYAILIAISVILYALTARGNLGIPTPYAIEHELSVDGREFETSQERSRYAMILSIYHHGTIWIDPYASIGTPDIGKINGHYYSFFPPAISIFALPLYHLGLLFGATQMLTFFISTLFALGTMLLMLKVARSLNLSTKSALLAAISFGFATNAWGYSVTLYAHLASAFFLLLAIYITVMINSSKKALVAKMLSFWIIYGVAIFIDYPNLFIFLPLAFMNFFQAFAVRKNKENLKITIDWRVFWLPLVFVICLILYGMYNNYFFGSPLQLSNTIPRVTDISDIQLTSPEAVKDSFDALNTRRLLNGFYTFSISLDRGVLVYSPIVIFGLMSLLVKRKKYDYLKKAVLSTSLMCFVLYSMFVDPWGGWAFGSRYMIAIFPGLLILAAVFWDHYLKNIFMKFLVSLVFGYSCAVSLLAPLTTNAIPPVVEAKPLELTYTYQKAIEMVKEGSLNSFIYNNYLNGYIKSTDYYFLIWAVVFFVAAYLIWFNKARVKVNKRK